MFLLGKMKNKKPALTIYPSCTLNGC